MYLSIICLLDFREKINDRLLNLQKEFHNFLK